MEETDSLPQSGPLPDGRLDEGPDVDWQEYLAWLDREIASGRDREPEPEPWTPEAPPAVGMAAEGIAAEGIAAEGIAAEGIAAEGIAAKGIAVGGIAAEGMAAGGMAAEASAVDGLTVDGLAVDGMGPGRGGFVQPGFWQGDEADLLPPGPLLAGLTEQAVTCLDGLSDNELIGVLQATRRQVTREQYKQVLVTAEFGRRRQAAFTDAASRGIPVGCRPGGFPGEELAIELVTTTVDAGHRIDDALDLTDRLPATLAGLAAGKIDEARAGWIAFYSRSLDPADAASADEILADAAPDLRVEQLARKAAALEKKLNPKAVAARRMHAKLNEQRVEARRELSGNASLSGRELDTTDVLAAKAHIDAIAVELRRSGLVMGNLDQLRALAFADLTQGRNPLDRTRPAPAQAPAEPEAAGSPNPAPARSHAKPEAAGSPNPALAPARSPGGPQFDGAANPAPLPALINLLVPVGTLLGLSDTPADAGRWGILDRVETQAVVAAASQHPRTRWCVTLTAPDGTAVAHGCARGRHPRLLTDLAPQPPPQLGELLRRLGVIFTPVAGGSCDHTQAEDHYTPSRALRHLVRARAAFCDAPGCQAPATSSDLDHTAPWPDGPTEQCNLAPRCRTHHRAKQARDWRVEQVAPGVTRWTLPSGRTHVTTPTRYDV